MKNASFSPNDFIKSMHEKSLSRKLSVDGVVKAVENKDAILFSMYSPNDWIEIPASLIEEIEYWDSTYENENSYHAVRVVFNEPDPNNKNEKALLSFLSYVIQSSKILTSANKCDCKDKNNAPENLPRQTPCGAFCNACWWTGLPTWCKMCDNC